MTALAKDRNTARRELRGVRDKVAASATCFMGGIAVLNATGFAQPGSTAVGLKARGVFTETVNNSTGVDGAESVDIRKGTFKLANDGSITIAHIEGTGYIVDDQTVAFDDGGGSRSAAGRIIQVDTDGVWIEFV